MSREPADVVAHLERERRLRLEVGLRHLRAGRLTTLIVEVAVLPPAVSRSV